MSKDEALGYMVGTDIKWVEGFDSYDEREAYRTQIRAIEAAKNGGGGTGPGRAQGCGNKAKRAKTADQRGVLCSAFADSSGSLVFLKGTQQPIFK